MPDRDIGKAHPLLASRWPALRARLSTAGIVTSVNEVWRSNERQQWLYGGGRTAAQLVARGVPTMYARPTDPLVTNAWSAATTAHGWTESGRPAACALDVVPLGRDGRPWTADDPWDEFVALVEDAVAQTGLRHFRDHGGCITDRPHLQLSEWSDLHDRPILPDPPTPLPNAA